MSDNIQEILNAAIQAKVIEALNDNDEAINKLVLASLSVNVDNFGEVSKSGWDNKTPYLEWLVGREIRRAAALAVEKYVTDNIDQIHAKIEAALLADGEISKTIAATFSDAIKQTWSWEFKIGLSE